MKWPVSVTVLRHGQSGYNILKALKMADPEYLAFKAAYEADYRSDEAKTMAIAMRQKYSLMTSDYNTPLTPTGKRQAFISGKHAPNHIPKPDVVLYSPYNRTHDTTQEFANGWESTGSLFSNVPLIADDRLREQEHGLSLLYSDWRIFHVFHPEQKELHDLVGDYAYQFPQGESTSQVRERCRQVQNMFIREFAGMNVLVVTHHLWKLSFRANIERLTPEEFVYLDTHEKPVNCGLTRYNCNPDLGRDGKLILEFYNKQLYTNEEVTL